MEDSTQLQLTLIRDGDKCGQDEANCELKMTKQGRKTSNRLEGETAADCVGQNGFDRESGDDRLGLNNSTRAMKQQLLYNNIGNSKR